MGWKDLITDAGTGQTSNTKIFSIIAYSSVTYAVLNADFSGPTFPELVLVYLGVVGGATTASKFLSLKYGPPQEKIP